MPVDRPRASGAVTFRFYAELNDHLPSGSRPEVTVEVDGARAAGDLIEQLGVPLGEVDLILVQGKSARPTTRVGPGDRVAVYPVFESFDVGGETRLRSEGLRELRFLVDTDLADLTKLLRDTGFDVRTAKSEDVVDEAQMRARILLTRNADLIDDPRLTHGLRVVGPTGPAQLAHLGRRIHLGTSQVQSPIFSTASETA